MDYDANLGEITVQDREYALDLMADLEDDNEGQSALETIAQCLTENCDAFPIC